MIRVFKSGRHSHRIPLSYPDLWPLFETAVVFVDRPSDADLYLFGQMTDIEEAPLELIEDWRQRRRPVIWLSEEPFWDTIWGRRPLAPQIYVDTVYGPVPVHQLNHQTSSIYQFDRIPYYLLTNHRFVNAYAYRLGLWSRMSVRDWAEHLRGRSVDLTFMFERRPERYHAISWPEADLFGLCSWRTEVAMQCKGSGVERLGQSWGAGLSRFDLKTDWHTDKLVRLDGRSRLLGAVENTHQYDYITEKFFDAFACRSIPVYLASPGHRIHELGLPPESWINLYGMSPEEAAQRLERVDCQAAAEVLPAAIRIVADLMSDPDTWIAERARLRDSLLAALHALLDGQATAT